MLNSRDHKAAYQRRIERALARGLSRSQARGHARAGELPIRATKVSKDNSSLEAGLKALHSTGSLRDAARKSHVSPERLRRYLSENDLAHRQGRTWVITDQRPRMMKAFVDGKTKNLRLSSFQEASLNGRHLKAVQAFLKSNRAEPLGEFAGLTVTDASGVAHVLETDPNKLYELAAAGSEPFEQIYRLIT